MIRYMDHIQRQEYEEMYAMINQEASGNVSPEDFIKRNSAIYEGIEAQNVETHILSYDKKKLAVTYHAWIRRQGRLHLRIRRSFWKGKRGMNWHGMIHSFSRN